MRRTICLLAIILLFAGTSASAAELLATDGGYEAFVGTLNPVAYFRFENNALDSSGHGYDGALMNTPTFVAGQSLNGITGNQAINLQGDDWVQINNAGQAVVAAGQAFSWSAFVMPTSASGGPQMLAVNRADGGNRSLWRISSTGTADVYNGDNNTTLDTGIDIVDPDWHHIAYTRASAGGTGRYYIDGVEVATHSAAWVYNSTDVWSLGTEFDGPNGTLPGNYYQGLMDEVSLFDYALTADQVLALSNIDAQIPLSPEPGTLLLMMLGMGFGAALLWGRRGSLQ